MWVQTPWGVFEVKSSFFMYNTIFVYILRVPVSMKGSKGHQRSRKQRKQTGFKELAHICVLCSAIASPSLLSSSPIRVNPRCRARCPPPPTLKELRNHAQASRREYRGPDRVFPYLLHALLNEALHIVHECISLCYQQGILHD